MINWSKVSRKIEWYFNYSGIFEGILIIYFAAYWIYWCFSKRLNEIEILGTLTYISTLIIIWITFWKIMRFFFQFKLNIFKKFSNKKLLRLSITNPEKGNLFFKIYLLRIVSTKIWKVFFSLSRYMRKRFIINWNFG